MSSSAHIKLPLHVKNRHILEVIGKCVGVPFRKMSFAINNGIAPSFDPHLPAGEDNPWSISFEPSSSFELAPAENSELSFGRILFTDIAGQSHGWFFHAEADTEDHKLVSPPSSRLSIAVGRRLVRFFGGQLIYDDNKETVGTRKSPRKALYPPPSRQPRGEIFNPNARWYLFQNALDSMKLITSLEMEEASKWAAYKSASRDEKLLEVLIREENHQSLVNAVKDMPAAARPGPRL